MTNENRILKGEIVNNDGLWYATVTKEFTEENGGGVQVFKSGVTHDSPHRAIDDLKQMITLLPAQRTTRAVIFDNVTVTDAADGWKVGI